MARLTRLERDDLSPEGQAVWDDLPSIGQWIAGPHQVLIRRPPVCAGVARTIHSLRGGLLTEAEHEFAILAIGRVIGSDYLYVRHQGAARSECGVRGEAIDALAGDGDLAALTAAERITVESPRQLTRDHRLNDELYARAYVEFGEERLVELVALILMYNLMGSLVETFGNPG